MYTFVTGGYRSGRSNYALRRAAELGPPPWCYVACGDESGEMIQKRIERHRRDHEAIWRIEPLPDDLAGFLASDRVGAYGALVIDGFSSWLERHIEQNEQASDSYVLGEVEGFAEILYRTARPIVLVTREVGLAPLPDAAAARRRVRMVTSANQILATNASSVVFMVSGVPLRVR